MADLKKILTAFILITLFTFLIIGFATQLAGNYDKDEEASELEDRLNSRRITTTVGSINETAKDWQEDFVTAGDEDQGILADLLDIIGFLAVSVFRLGGSMITFILIPFEVFSEILHGVLGIPTIVMSIIYALLLISLIFAVWRLIKIGR